VWGLDFQFDQAADGKTLKLLHVVEEFTRARLAIDCHRRDRRRSHRRHA
jgi:putative transposase